MTDLKSISDLLKQKGKVRGNPVGISLFRDAVPEEYEPVQEAPCAIVHLAMDQDRKVYFDADHHDCLVGVHHTGITPGCREIVSGEYLSNAMSFFTYEGAARLKSGTPSLPPGMVKAIGAAPLDQVPESVTVDWIVAVCDPHHANFIASCRLAREGVRAYGAFGTSLCAEVFSVPWHINNIVVTFGDVGGRMHNKIKKDQLFVVVPMQFVDYLPMLFNNQKVDVAESRKYTKPAHSKFWKEEKGRDPGVEEVEAAEPSVSPEEATLSMPWTDEARKLLANVPEGIVEMVVENSETFAREKGYPEVSRRSLDEQLGEMGTSVEELMESEF